MAESDSGWRFNEYIKRNKNYKKTTKKTDKKTNIKLKVNPQEIEYGL